MEKGPQRRGEPCVEGVGILSERSAAALRAALGSFLCDHRFSAVRAVVRGDAVSPPKLTRDAPIADILHPVEIVFLESLGDELYPAVAHCVDRGTRKRLHFDEPLKRSLRLDSGSAAVAGADIVNMILDGDKAALLLEIGDDLLSRLISVHSRVSRIVVGDLRVVGEHIENLEPVTLADLEVVGVVSGSDLHAARSEIALDILVGDNGDSSADKREDEHFSDDVLITLVVRVNRNRRIAEKGFGACRCDLDISASVLERIADMPKCPGCSSYSTSASEIDVRHFGHQFIILFPR